MFSLCCLIQQTIQDKNLTYIVLLACSSASLPLRFIQCLYLAVVQCVLFVCLDVLLWQGTLALLVLDAATAGA